MTWEKRQKGWRMSYDVGEATEGLEMTCDVGEATEGSRKKNVQNFEFSDCNAIW